MLRYKVLVDDNFHYQDPGERREHGAYDTLEEALAACREIVDRSLEEERRPGISAERCTNAIQASAKIHSSSWSVGTAG